MKIFKTILTILVIFFQTGNVLSDKNIFNVNNIEIKKQSNSTNQSLANQAIKEAFNELKEKILMDEESIKLSNLDYVQIKELVSYYQVKSKKESASNDVIMYNIFFDRDKLYNLFNLRNIFYSEILDKELYVLPIHKKENQIFIFNNNIFYEKWNEVSNIDVVEFILPLENIEIIEYINNNKNNLLDVDLNNLFEEYKNKNLALVYIEERKLNLGKVFLKTKILGKNISKNIKIEKKLDKEKFYEEIISDLKNEITNIIKSQNLIDVKTPSFLNVKLLLNKKDNFVELNRRLEKIDLIENIFVQEFNSKFILFKIKYFGKLDKIINQLEDQKIMLQFIDEQWRLEVI